MRCVKPFLAGKAAFGCGQCMPCRIARRRTWTHRLMLESLDHADNSFVTLTYSPEFMPSDCGLVPEHFRDWLKRLRRRVEHFPGAVGEPRRIRFYGVGEYGNVSSRPHYHCALFGWPSCSAIGKSVAGVCQCLACSVVRETWGFGHVMCGRLEMKSAQYLARYVTKKMTRRDDVRLGGRYPEFSRMSLRPGIGANAMWNVASEMMRYRLEKKGDVPLALRFGAKKFPLGRYLRDKLREMVDSDEKFKEAALQELAVQVQVVRAFAFANDRSVRSVFEEINGPHAVRLEAREKIRMQHEAI